MTSPTEQALEAMSCVTPFEQRVSEENAMTLPEPTTLQVNVGWLCNLQCKHCHVEGGPDRTDTLMSKEAMQACLDVVKSHGMKVIDITGGAPEMNPNFEWFIKEAAATGATVMVRSNLVILDIPKYAHLPQLMHDLGITLIASLPHYNKKVTDKMRGEGSFDKIIEMLQKLNAIGYGKPGGPELDLVFNPSGAILPPLQSSLEAEYKRRLGSEYGIEFNNLFAIANNPLGRFGNFLADRGILETYMKKLEGAFNPATVPAMMCRNQLSIGYDGKVYDCDFNQAAEMPCLDGRTIFDYANDPGMSLQRKINFGNHCYACCAGSGSSCGGATA